MGNNGGPVWQLENQCALLRVGELTGQIELNQPAKGIANPSWQGEPIGAHCLGIVGDGQQDQPLGPVQDSFVRGSDLVVSYAPTEQRPHAAQVYWRAVKAAAGGVLLDVIVFLQTDLLESYPQLATCSELRCDEVLVPTRGPADESLPIVESDWQTIENETAKPGSGCVLFRHGRSSWSYAEMAHPQDSVQWQLELTPPGRQIQWQFSGEFLEKGVIRCGRIRAALLPREADLRLAANYWAEFAAQPPPLTV